MKEPETCRVNVTMIHTCQVGHLLAASLTAVVA